MVHPIVTIDSVGQITMDFAIDFLGGTCLHRVGGSLSDPALALPLRRQEGEVSLSSDQRELNTKEIACRIDPLADAFELAARVHNYSLQETPSSVDVDFHIGNPGDGGVLIAQGSAGSIVSQDRAGGVLDNEVDVICPSANCQLVPSFASLHTDRVCDGSGSAPAGTACSDNLDCGFAEDDTTGECVATLIPPYTVCDANSHKERRFVPCADDDFCRNGDLSGSCIAETRIFASVDPEDAITPELSDGNNLGWRDFAGEDCFATTTVPEPEFLMLYALVTLGGLRVCRRSQRGPKSNAR